MKPHFQVNRPEKSQDTSSDIQWNAPRKGKHNLLLIWVFLPSLDYAFVKNGFR